MINYLSKMIRDLKGRSLNLKIKNIGKHFSGNLVGLLNRLICN